MKYTLRIKNKKNFKHTASKCHICEESDYNVLDVHRIKWGGSYTEDNCVVLCVKCHRLVHAKKIIIYRWFNSTKGRVLHFIDEYEVEHFK